MPLKGDVVTFSPWVPFRINNLAEDGGLELLQQLQARSPQAGSVTRVQSARNGRVSGLLFAVAPPNGVDLCSHPLKLLNPKHLVAHRIVATALTR